MSEDIKTTLTLLIDANTKKIDADLSRLSKKIEGLEHKSKSSGKGIGAGLSAGLPDISKFGLAAGAAGLAMGALSVGLEKLFQKEDQLADLSAITGITGTKLQEFGDIATELSSKFGTSVVENIESFKGVISRLGPAIAENSGAMRTMAEDINVLAKASGLTATQSMDALTTSILQFGVDLSDPVAVASTMTEMMNIMAAGAKEGAAEVPQLSAALTQTGSTAKSLNISFSETTAALEILATKGKYGSEAGIGLRNSMVALTKPSKEAASQLKELGYSAEQFNTTLTEKGLSAAFGELNDVISKNGSLSDQASLKVKLFGSENLASAGAMLDGAKAIGEMNEKIQGTNTAFDQAATKMATTSEQFKRMKEDSINTLVKGLEDLGSAVGDKITGIVNEIDRMAAAFGALIRLDISEFWNTLTMNINDYVGANEKKLNQMDAEINKQKQLLDLEAKKHATAQTSADLSKELLTKLEKTSGSEVDRFAKLSKATTDYTTKAGKSFADLGINAKKGLIVQEFQNQFNAGKVKSIDEFFLALDNINKKNTDKVDENDKEAEKKRKEALRREAEYQAARIANIKDPLIKLDEIRKEELRLNDVSESDDRTKAERRLTIAANYTVGVKEFLDKQVDDRTKFIDDLDKLSKKLVSDQQKNEKEITDLMRDGMDDKERVLFDEQASFEDSLKALNTMLEQKQIDTEKYNKIYEGLQKQHNKRLKDISDQRTEEQKKDDDERKKMLQEFLGYYQGVAGIFGSSLGNAMLGGQDALKEGFKSILIETLNFLEKMLVLAKLETLISAVSNPLTLLYKAAPLLLAMAGFEAAKAAVNSFAVGSWNIPNDQMAMVHKNELIVPAPMASKIRSGEAVLSSGSNAPTTKRRKSPSTLRGTIDVNISSFEKGNRYSTFQYEQGIA